LLQAGGRWRKAGADQRLGAAGRRGRQVNEFASVHRRWPLGEGSINATATIAVTSQSSSGERARGDQGSPAARNDCNEEGRHTESLGVDYRRRSSVDQPKAGSVPTAGKRRNIHLGAQANRGIAWSYECPESEFAAAQHNPGVLRFGNTRAPQVALGPRVGLRGLCERSDSAALSSSRRCFFRVTHPPTEDFYLLVLQ
jgi:hypothetical protein